MTRSRGLLLCTSVAQATAMHSQLTANNFLLPAVCDQEMGSVRYCGLLTTCITHTIKVLGLLRGR